MHRLWHEHEEFWVDDCICGRIWGHSFPWNTSAEFAVVLSVG